MAEMINLRRARKQKARQAKSLNAEASRQEQAISKPDRARAAAQKDKDVRSLDNRKLDER